MSKPSLKPKLRLKVSPRGPNPVVLVRPPEPEVQVVEPFILAPKEEVPYKILTLREKPPIRISEPEAPAKFEPEVPPVVLAPREKPPILTKESEVPYKVLAPKERPVLTREQEPPHKILTLKEKPPVRVPEKETPSKVLTLKGKPSRSLSAQETPVQKLPPKQELKSPAKITEADLLKYSKYDTKESDELIRYKSEIIPLLSNYLFHVITAETICRGTIHINYTSLSGIAPILDPKSKRYLKDYSKSEDKPSFSVMFLDSMGSKAQILYINNIKKIFIIIDPRDGKEDKTRKLLSDKVNEVLQGYSYHEIPCVILPQSISKTQSCNLWNLLLSDYLCSGIPYEELYKNMVTIPNRKLESVFRGFVNYCYTLLEKQGLLESAEYIRDIRLSILEKELLTTPNFIDSLLENLNNRAILGQRGDSLFSDMVDEVHFSNVPQNGIYKQLKKRKLTERAFRFLILAGQIATFSDLVDEFQGVLFKIPKKNMEVDKIYLLMISSNMRKTADNALVSLSNESELNPRNMEDKFIINKRKEIKL